MRNRAAFLVSALCLLPGVLHASWDIIDSERPAVWRTSQTCAAANFVILAATSPTTPVIIRGVTVDSMTVNQGGDSSFISIFNSTTVPMLGGGNASNFTSTGTFTITGPVTSGAGASYAGDSYIYDAYFTSGAVINKIGGGCVTIFWDFASVHKPAKSGARLTFWDLIFPWRP